MAIVVEHDKRRKEILKKSLELFTKEGYGDVTFQKIADSCGITRTTLYIYFKNKREIFAWSIKQMTESMEKKLVEIIREKDLTAQQCLRRIMIWILDECNENRQLFNVLLVYLMNLKKAGENTEELVNRRILRAKHLLNMIIIGGQKRGEFKKMDIKKTSGMFYDLIEAAIFELAVIGKPDASDTKETLELLIQGILA